MDQPITRAEHEEFVRRMQDEHKKEYTIVLLI